MILVICALIGAAFGLLIGYGFGWARAMREGEAMLAPLSQAPLFETREPVMCSCRQRC